MAPRGNNSLNVITRKFIEWIIRGDTVNLNEAAAILRVSKRRLYDVVNVLEGIGVLEKCGMNQVRWSDLRDRTRSSDLYSQCANLRQLEVEIDMSVRGLVSALKCVEMDTAASQYAYVRLEDLRSSQMFTDKTLIVVKSSTQRDIKTSLSQPMNSLLSQVKFETSGRTTLQGFISPAGSYVHSDFEQHLFGNGCPNFLTDRALSTPGIDVVIKQESCHSEDWKVSFFIILV
ncbi:transcription factor E2F/dimerization partner [Ostertagia ostertagi]